MINSEKTIEPLELHRFVPAAKSINKSCDLFELPLEYFDKYYSLYFKHPEESFIEWKNINGYSYSDCISILECSRSALLTFVRCDYGLFYNMYLKMKRVGIF